MTSQEFTQWLRGFTEGVHEYNITPKQWDLLKERLAEVNDNKFVEPPGMFQVHPQPPYPGVQLDRVGTQPGTGPDRYPWGGQVVWGGAGTAGPPIDCLTTSRQVPIPSDSNITGSVSIPSVWTSNPNSVTYTVTSGSSYSGPVTYTYPNGTTVSYTTSGNETWNIQNKDLSND